MAKARLSLHNRVLLATLAAVLGVTGLATFHLRDALARLFQREGNRTLEVVGAKVVERLEEQQPELYPEPPESDPVQDEEGNPLPPKTPEPPPPPRLDRSLLQDSDQVEVRVLRSDGVVLLETEDLGRRLPQALLPALGAWTWHEVDGPTGAHFMVRATRFEEGWVLTAWDIRREHRLLKQSQDLLLGVWGLAALLSAVLAAAFARRGLAPLEDLAHRAGCIRPGALRLDLEADQVPAELKPLVEGLHGALARLDEAFERLKGLNADVAHELRTPIHGIRLEVEGLLARCPHGEAEPLEGLLETLDQLTATLDQMLFLARAEDPALAMDIQDLEVRRLVSQAAAPFESLAEEKGVTVVLEVPEALRVQADEHLARRALHNLLANALRHAPRDSQVRVGAMLGPAGLTLQVQDQGEGMPAEFLARIGERFLRRDRSRNRGTGGAGLGLAIVTAIMRLHGGRWSVESREGEGTTVSLHFPLSGARAAGGQGPSPSQTV